MQCKVFEVDKSPLQSVINIMDGKISRDNPDGAKMYFIMNQATQDVLKLSPNVFIDNSLEIGVVDVR